MSQYRWKFSLQNENTYLIQRKGRFFWHTVEWYDTQEDKRWYSQSSPGGRSLDWIKQRVKELNGEQER